ncbi:Os06g0282900, partial [Oryza sativa Japonica Group]
LPLPATTLLGCVLLGNTRGRRRRHPPVTGAPPPPSPSPFSSLGSLWKRRRRDGRKKKRKRKEKNLPDRVYFILDGNLWYFKHRIIRLPISDLFALEQESIWISSC